MKKILINQQQYAELYKTSIDNPEKFWDEQAQKYIAWFKPYDKVLEGTFRDQNIQWFKNGTLNACYNCVDRHLPDKASQIAFYWEGNDPNEDAQLTYQQLYEQVCRFANVLKKRGIQKGDRVCIYLPMIPEVVIAMLACARIGAIHSVIFGGFSAEAIKSRITDANCSMVITANIGFRANKTIPLKGNVDEALLRCPSVKSVMVIQRDKTPIQMKPERDFWYHEIVDTVSDECPCEEMDADSPLFILYTSGSTGTPKGILHTTGGYLVYAAITHHLIFNYQPDDIYWCTADVGWITGHTYLVYGPLCNGATNFIFEGVPNYPTPSRYWELIDKYKINTLYTSPTAIRALRQEDEKWLKSSSRKSLTLLGTVGEPINPDVWEWYHEKIGNGNCPIVDTWWQTETGGVLISPLPDATPLKPGSTSWPFLGIKAEILDDNGKICSPNQMGKLVISQPWPGMAKTIYNNPERFFNAYFKEYPNHYLAGDEAKYDEEGYFWVLGRFDDVLKISGHRIGTGEVENAILTHTSVAEAAVVPVPDAIKGESIYAFVVLKNDMNPDDNLKKEIILSVRKYIGAIATPEYIQWATGLPKTRSGKIMRRILKKIANSDVENLGDTSTLADPNVIKDLIEHKLTLK